METRLLAAFLGVMVVLTMGNLMLRFAFANLQVLYGAGILFGIGIVGYLTVAIWQFKLYWEQSVAQYEKEGEEGEVRP